MSRTAVRRLAPATPNTSRCSRLSRSDTAQWHAFMQIETRLAQLRLVLPAPLQTPANVRLPFTNVRVRGNRAFVAGHGPLQPDGSLAGPFGKVPVEVSVD